MGPAGAGLGHGRSRVARRENRGRSAFAHQPLSPRTSLSETPPRLTPLEPLERLETPRAPPLLCFLTLATSVAAVTTSPLQTPALFFFSLPLRFRPSAAGPAFASPLKHCSQQSAPPLLSAFLVCRTYASSKKKKKMPPKKVAVEEKVLLGRPGNNLKSGIVCETGRPAPPFLCFLCFAARFNCAC